MNFARHKLGWPYWVLSSITLIIGIAMAAFYAPSTSGTAPVEKALYLHVPAAVSTLMICLVVFIANVGYIWQRTEVWDDLAEAAAQVAVLFCSVVLVTGMVWAHQSWGVWWTWSPLLTFSLILWLLYVAYLVIHASVATTGRRALVCAMYGVVAFVDVPLLYLSVKLLPDRHPSDLHLLPRQWTTLVYWVIPSTMIWAGLVLVLFRHGVQARLNPRPSHRPRVVVNLSGKTWSHPRTR